MNRRQFGKGLLASLSSYALLDSLFAFNAFGRKINPIADHWSIQLEEYCNDLKTNTISPENWQVQVEGLLSRIELAELLKFIDFDRLLKGFQYPDLGVNTRPVKFPKLEGLPENTTFYKKIFGLKKDRAIIPHGHSNMSSAHMVLRGGFKLRHYDKLDDEGDFMIIKPTIDKMVQTGDFSSISDDRDNIHWFVASTASAFTFDVIVLDLKGQPYDIHNIDIHQQVRQSDGNLRVPKLDVDTALKKYGKETHH